MVTATKTRRTKPTKHRRAQLSKKEFQKMLKSISTRLYPDIRWQTPAIEKARKGAEYYLNAIKKN